MNTPNESVCAYLAGLLDGEGCFTLVKIKHGYRPVILVGMTHKNTIDWLHARFEGWIGRIQPKGNREVMYRWTVTSRPPILKIIELTLPFLITKALQARTLQEYCIKFKKDRPFSKEEKEGMEVYREIFKLINARGRGTAAPKEELEEILRKK